MWAPRAAPPGRICTGIAWIGVAFASAATGVPNFSCHGPFQPLHDRVLVRRVQSDEKTKGGLIIPDSAKEKPAEGEIVSVGEGARKEENYWRYIIPDLGAE